MASLKLLPQKGTTKQNYHKPAVAVAFVPFGFFQPEFEFAQLYASGVFGFCWSALNYGTLKLKDMGTQTRLGSPATTPTFHGQFPPRGHGPPAWVYPREILVRGALCISLSTPSPPPGCAPHTHTHTHTHTKGLREHAHPPA